MPDCRDETETRDCRDAPEKMVVPDFRVPKENPECPDCREERETPDCLAVLERMVCRELLECKE